MKEMIIRETLRFVFICIILVTLFLVFRPTLYYYDTYTSDGYHYFVRIDKITGKVYHYNTTKGEWELISK